MASSTAGALLMALSTLLYRQHVGAALVDYGIDQGRKPPQGLGFLVSIFVAIMDALDALDALDRMPHDALRVVARRARPAY